MRSELVFRTPSNGAGWQETWVFSGRDDSLLRACLAELDQYLTEAPVERWEQDQYVIVAEDRWLAAMLQFAPEVRSVNQRFAYPRLKAERAWTAAGARHLAEILPDELIDLRDSIEQRFGSSGHI